MELLSAGCLLLEAELNSFGFGFEITGWSEASLTTFERNQAQAAPRPSGAICLSFLFLIL